MARSPRKYAVPLVVTFTALAPACAGKITGAEDNAGGGGTTVAGDGDLGTGGGAGANPPGWGDTGGTGAAPSAPLACDLNQLLWLEECPENPECLVDVRCTGGSLREFSMTCQEVDGYAGWVVGDVGCDHYAEACTATLDGVRFFCDGAAWRFSAMDANFNPPAPCPQTRPEEGGACLGGDGFGSDAVSCAYPCENGAWTVMGCEWQVGKDIHDAVWGSDGACHPGAGGSAGGAPE